MFRRHKYQAKKRKPRRRAAKTPDSKAKSLQTAWRMATDRKGTLPMEDARKIVADPPSCPYCQKPIPYREISIDHIQPRSKGGTSEPDNLVYCDRRCNQAKGNLTGVEFKALMAFLNEHPSIRESVMSRLIAGGAAWGRGRRRRR